jgi:Cytochrome P450
MAEAHILKAKQDHLSGRRKEDHDRVSLFHFIVNSDMPESELSTDRLTKEAQVLLGAGSASTARTLDFIVYYVIAKKHIRAKLQNELRDIMAGYPDQIPSWLELEKLPYLQAIIKEGYRRVQSMPMRRSEYSQSQADQCATSKHSLSYGVMDRLPRCSPDVAIQYKQWRILRGVSGSIFFCRLACTNEMLIKSRNRCQSACQRT